MAEVEGCVFRMVVVLILEVTQEVGWHHKSMIIGHHDPFLCSLDPVVEDMLNTDHTVLLIYQTEDDYMGDNEFACSENWSKRIVGFNAGWLPE